MVWCLVLVSCCGCGGLGVAGSCCGWVLGCWVWCLLPFWVLVGDLVVFCCGYSGLGFVVGEFFVLVCYNNVVPALMFQGLFVFCVFMVWFTLLWLLRFSV